MGKRIRKIRDIYAFVRAVIEAVGENKNDQDLGKTIRHMVLQSREHFEVTEVKD